MQVASVPAFRAAALLGFASVALGAFGAHGLHDVLASRQTATVWETAVFYQFIHALVILGLACLRPFPAMTCQLFGAGILLFSGSLYVLALSGIHWVGFLTPLGGLCFLAAWLQLAWQAGRFTQTAPEPRSEPGALP